MEPIRALICDDEPLALDRLGDLLSRCPEVEVLGSLLAAGDLVEALGRGDANVVFLDIEMPRMDGFDVVEALSRMAWNGGTEPPLIIFVTAHPELAANAFNSGALDFISKPVRLSRLEQALERARRAIERREAGRRLAELSAQLEELKRLCADTEADQHIWVRKGAETIRLEVQTIDWIEAEGEYVRIHAGASSFLERGSLTDATARLAPFGFVRIHRSAVINPEQVVAVEKSGWGGLVLRLGSGARVSVGRKYREVARALTANGLTGGAG